VLAGYEHNPKAKVRLKQFIKDQFRHSPYGKVPVPNADEAEYTYWDYGPYVPPDVSTVSWDLNRDYAFNYNHVYWCRASCSTKCNPKNRGSVLHIACLHEGDSEAPLHQACGAVEELKVERYMHDQDCTGGCGNCCVERELAYQAFREERALSFQEARMSALALAEVPAPAVSDGGWGSSSPADPVIGGWGRPGEQQADVSWGARAFGGTQNSGGGWGSGTSVNQNTGGWGSGTSVDQNTGGWGSGTSVNQNTGGWGSGTSVNRNNGGWGASVPVDHSGGGWGASAFSTNNSSGWGAGSSGNSRPQEIENGDSDSSSECYDSEERRWRKHSDEPGTPTDSDDGDGRDNVSMYEVRPEVRDRPQEVKAQYQAVWQCNMAVFDKEANVEQIASYTNSAAESESSPMVDRGESSVRSEAIGAECSQDPVKPSEKLGSGTVHEGVGVHGLYGILSRGCKPDSDDPLLDNTKFPNAFLSSADAQAIVDLYVAKPSLPHWQEIPMFERSTHVHLPSSTLTFVVRTDACGETKNRTFEIEQPGAVRMYFTNRRLSPSKTKKANPEGGVSQTVERAQLQETFVTNYTA